MPTSPNWEKFKKIVADELYILPSEVTLDVPLYELAGGDIVDFVSLTFSLEEEFGISFGEVEVGDIETVGDLLAYIDEHTL